MEDGSEVRKPQQSPEGELGWADMGRSEKVGGSWGGRAAPPPPLGLVPRRTRHG